MDDRRSGFAANLHAALAGFPPRTVLKNPGHLGRWLQPLCKCQWTLKAGHGKTYAWEDLEVVESQPNWQLPSTRVRVPDQPEIEVELISFAPIGLDDVATSSLPVLCMDLQSHSSVSVEIACDCLESHLPGVLLCAEEGACASVALGKGQTSQRGVEGRKFSPHACLLYLAALTRALSWGRRMEIS